MRLVNRILFGWILNPLRGGSSTPPHAWNDPEAWVDTEDWED